MNQIAKRPENAIQLLGDKAFLRRCEMAAEGRGKGNFSVQNMMVLVANAIRQTPKLRECSPESLAGALITCAKLRLEPNTPMGKAYLIPFEKRQKNKTTGKWETVGSDCQLIIGYRGLVEMAYRTGNLAKIYAEVVFEGDDFSFAFGTDDHLRHVPRFESETPLSAYAYARTKDGSEAFVVYPWQRVLSIRDRSQGFKQAESNSRRNSPWHTDTVAMAQKTMIRAIFNRARIETSVDFLDMNAVDDRLVDMAAYGRGALAAPPVGGDAPYADLQELEAGDEGEWETVDDTPPPPVARRPAPPAQRQDDDAALRIPDHLRRNKPQAEPMDVGTLLAQMPEARDAGGWLFDSFEAYLVKAILPWLEGADIRPAAAAHIDDVIAAVADLKAEDEAWGEVQIFGDWEAVVREKVQ